MTKAETTEQVETPQGIRPEDLARELGVSGKLIRAFLRAEFPRPIEAKNTSWILTEAQAEAVRARFAPVEETEDSEEFEELEV